VSDAAGAEDPHGERSLVLQRQRQLKWRALDGLEAVLMMLCGFTLAAFSLSVVCDIVTRTIGAPWLWLQEVTSTFFIYGIFIGAAVATRRNDHLYLAAVGESLTGRPRLVIEVCIRLVVIGVGLFLAWFGYVNFLRGFSSFRMPSMTPIASLYAAIPISGALIALFAFEQLVNGCRNGFVSMLDETPDELRPPS
jgi:TRAP-type C4-dicarboxylate transport system permease small subunit